MGPMLTDKTFAIRHTYTLLFRLIQQPYWHCTVVETESQLAHTLLHSNLSPQTALVRRFCSGGCLSGALPGWVNM
jgi:hypothetical protein